MSFIEHSLYKEIIQKIPIVCIDLLIEFEGQYLLVKRKENPLAGKWWVPGGRIQLNDTLEQSFKNKLFTELGLTTQEEISIAGVYEDFFETSSMGKHLYHTVSVVGDIKLKNYPEISYDKTIIDWKFCSILPERFQNKFRRI